MGHGQAARAALSPSRSRISRAIEAAEEKWLSSSGGLYSERRLAAAWAAQQFSDELLDLVNVDLHDAAGNGYDERVRRAALARLASSPAAQRYFGERYAGAG